MIFVSDKIHFIDWDLSAYSPEEMDIAIQIMEWQGVI